MKPQITIRSFIDAPPDIVWQTITDHKLVSQWLMETNIQPVIGFRGYFQMKSQPGFDGKLATEVIEVVVNNVFAFTWQGGWIKKPTTVRFTLEERDGGTLLTLEHWGFEGFLGGVLRLMMTPGWKKKLVREIPSLIRKMS
ncbi:MAG: SRPBCC domain-containing protein [Taibaiella sp.]|nr:SRPBCC domain-containing protein [Taibaiella sp.]